jgi:hypothetical protein
MTLPLKIETDFVCGTRRVKADYGVWRVVCATCENGGSHPYRRRDEACTACVRDSNKPCRKCGAA